MTSKLGWEELSAKLAELGYDVKLVVATLPNFVKTDTKEERRSESTNLLKYWDVQPQIYWTFLPKNSHLEETSLLR